MTSEIWRFLIDSKKKVGHCSSHKSSKLMKSFTEILRGFIIPNQSHD
jgi:hypothetical protein